MMQIFQSGYLKRLLQAYNDVMNAKDPKTKLCSLFTSHILDIGKTLDQFKSVITLVDFFSSQEWLDFSSTHLAEAIKKETAKPPGKANNSLEESLSVDYEDALNGADFDDNNKLFGEFGSSALDDDPWKQFNDFSPEEVVIEGLIGDEPEDNPNDQAFRLSTAPEKGNEEPVGDDNHEDPFEFKVLETDFVTAPLPKTPSPVEGFEGSNPYLLSSETDQKQPIEVTPTEIKEESEPTTPKVEAKPEENLIDNEFVAPPADK